MTWNDLGIVTMNVVTDGRPASANCMRTTDTRTEKGTVDGQEMDSCQAQRERERESNMHSSNRIKNGSLFLVQKSISAPGWKGKKARAKSTSDQQYTVNRPG